MRAPRRHGPQRSPRQGPRPTERGGRAARPAQRPEAAAETSWDHVAVWYDRLVGDEGSDYHRDVIIPAALQLLDLQPGQRVIDVCCGQGVLTRQLVQRGAAFVLGVDASPQLIDAARRREAAVPKPRSPGESTSPHARVQFECGDVTRPGPWCDASFDRAACLMAAHDVRDFPALADTLAAALRPGGRAVLVLMHPCFRIPRQSAWGWDEARQSQYRRIDRYATPLEIPIHTHPGRDPSEQTLYFHRPLADYLNALGQAGLAVVAAEEPLTHRRAAPGGRSRGENRAAGEIPVFLALAATRVKPGR